MTRLLISTFCLLLACSRDGGSENIDLGGSNHTSTDAIPRDRSNVALCTVDYEVDAGEDGSIDQTLYIEYGPLGWPELERQDTDGDGIDDEIVTYGERSAWGLYTHAERDDDGDGIADYVVDGEYEGPDWLFREIDTDGDGVVDEVWSYTRRESGDEGAEVLAEVNEGADGTIDVWWLYRYDDNHRELYVEMDVGGDGVPEYEKTVDREGDRILRRIERYDEVGETQTEVFEHADDATIYPSASELQVRVDGSLLYSLSRQYGYGELWRLTEVRSFLDVRPGNNLDERSIQNGSWDCP